MILTQRRRERGGIGAARSVSRRRAALVTPPCSRALLAVGARSRRVAVAGSVALVTVLASVPTSAAGTAPGPTSPPAPRVVPPLATSLLSPRRLPDWLVTNVAHARLASAVASVLSAKALGPAAGSTCALVTQGSTVLAARAPNEELIPASNMKLLTATAALQKLGPDFVYSTAVRADNPPVDGVVRGNLYLVGSGDPVLRTQPYVSSLPYAEPDYTSFAQLAEQVVKAGVREVTGSVVGDEGLFDTQRTVATWKPIYAAEGDVGPLSALDVNDGFVLNGGYYKAASQPAQSAADQFATLLAADGVKFVAAKRPPAPAGADVTPAEKAAANLATPPGDPATPTANPNLPAAAGATPSSSVPITSIDSPPLSEILQTILRASDDTGAELITKELGARFGDGGTTAAGVAVIRAVLAADGLPVSQLQAADGSGLDRSDRVTCRLILDDLTRDTDSILAAGLPVAGKTGTLESRLTSPLTAGRILAKTGTLDDVSALSGFVLPGPETPPAPGLNSTLVFSMIQNGLPSDAGDAVADRLATVLAGYPDAPPASSVSPR